MPWSRRVLAALCVVLCLSGPGAPAIAADDLDALELYVDLTTKQLFAEPGPGRVRLGVYRRDTTAARADAAPSAAGAAPAEPASTPSAPVPEAAPAAPAATAGAEPATLAGPAAPSAPGSSAAAPATAAPDVPRPAAPSAAAPTPAAPAAAVAAGAPASAAPTAAARPPVDATTEELRRVEARQRDLEERLERLSAIPPAAKPAAAANAPKKWYDNLSIRGYAQFRFNDVVSGDEDIRLWNDGSVGEDRGLFMRRGRIILSGEVSEHLAVYIQPDFASTAGDTNFVGQLRDFYGDIFFDKKKEYRLRVGQSKIPYGFENMQSSSQRLALDRADSMNSCCRDERDLGAFFYWAPTHVRDTLRDLVRNGLKGSGDYGLLAFGLYNGQGANRGEANDGFHKVARVTYPWTLKSGQIVEASLQAYTGMFTPTTDGRVPGLPVGRYNGSGGIKDERVGITTVWYPQPFGVQMEWNWGTGPQLNADRSGIEAHSLQGGYVQMMYRTANLKGTGIWIPFVRWQLYDGALKSQPNAPATTTNDWEFGVEWQPNPSTELTAVYQSYNRNDTTRFPYAQFSSDVFRLQLQINY
ncbi:MAG: OprO/OprP family phosphate-selective porin [Burkholderiales bacterium]|jgi:hypothetical protein|nr:OprO/OprP family phosphate-selective porin [Burkholderiales bacterium]